MKFFNDNINNDKNSTPMNQNNDNLNSIYNTSYQNNDNNIPPLISPITDNEPSFNQNNISVDNEELKRSFIGNNYDRITRKKFNFAGFFFTYFYMFYRKMYIYAIVVFLINTFLISIVKMGWITLIFNIILGFFVNKVYMFYVSKKIRKIIFSNPDKNLYDLKQICSSKGGVSSAGVVLGIILNIIIIIFISLTYSTSLLNINIIKLFKSININNETEKITDTYDSKNNTYDKNNHLITYGREQNARDNYTLTMPSAFIDFNDLSNYYYHYTSGMGSYDDCTMHFASTNYNDGNKLVSDMSHSNVNKDKIYTVLSNKTINKIKWTYFSMYQGGDIIYIYGTTKNNIAYLYEFVINKNADTNCKIYKDDILNSIKEK